MAYVWLTENDKFIWVLRAQGMTYKQIGVRIGITKAQVRASLAREAFKNQDAIRRVGVNLEEVQRKLQGVQGLTLRQIGKRRGISKERVWYILACEEQNAIERAGMDLQEIHRRLQAWSWRKHKLI